MALIAPGLASRSAGRKNGRKRAPRREGPKAQHRGFVLKVVDGPLQGKEHVFEREASIGRVDDNDVVVVEPGVSRHHARLYDHLGVYMLEDKGSANGTCLNGERIDGVEVLREGDHITLSQTTFQFSQLDVRRGEITKEVRLQPSALNELDVSKTSEVLRVGLLRGGRRKLLIVGSVAVLALAGLAYQRLVRGAAGEGADVSDVPISYDESKFVGNVFGYGEYDKTHRERAIVNFDYLGGRVTLQLGAWGIDKADEVEIVLNGERVGYLPLTVNRWVYGIRIELPRAKLRSKQPNELVFNASRNPPEADPWEIYDLHILQDPVPRPNEQEAYRQYKLGKSAWEDRQVEPGNMYTCLLRLKKARNLLEGLQQRPELYGVIMTFIKEVESELTRRFDEGLFTARRLQRVDDDLREAAEVLERTMRHFGKSDYRYRELRRFLRSLEEQEQSG